MTRAVTEQGGHDLNDVRACHDGFEDIGGGVNTAAARKACGAPSRENRQPAQAE